MNFLNWLYMKTVGLIKTKVNNPDTDLLVLGAQVPFSKRDDGYQTYAMTVKDFGNQIGAPQFKSTSTAQGTTITGITGIGMSSSVFIPKGTLNVDNTIIETMVGGFRSAGSNTVQLMIYLNDTNSLTGATLMATGLNYTSNNWNGKMLRTFPLTDGILRTTVAPGFLAMIDTTTPQIPSSYLYNPATEDLYIIFAMNNLATNNVSYTNFHKIICY